jgi:hypothetical protein
MRGVAELADFAMFASETSCQFCRFGDIARDAVADSADFCVMAERNVCSTVVGVADVAGGQTGMSALPMEWPDMIVAELVWRMAASPSRWG